MYDTAVSVRVPHDRAGNLTRANLRFESVALQLSPGRHERELPFKRLNLGTE